MELSAIASANDEKDLELQYEFNASWPLWEQEGSMKHEKLYKSCRCCCDFVGKTFYFQDVVGEILFIIGSLFFFIPPAAALSGNALNKVGADSVFIVGMASLTIGKFILETKAAYTELWKIPSLRLGFTYHLGIIFFFLGGLAFLVNLILDLTSVVYLSAVWAVVSGVLFTFGSVFFILNAFTTRSVKLPKIWRVDNLVLLASLCMFIGSVCYWIEGWVLICLADNPELADEGNLSITNARMCNRAFDLWLSFFGGLFFTLGSTISFVYAVHELRSRYHKFGGAMDS